MWITDQLVVPRKIKLAKCGELVVVVWGEWSIVNTFIPFFKITRTIFTNADVCVRNASLLYYYLFIVSLVQNERIY